MTTHVTRRRALATTAWATPTIVVASAVPAYASQVSGAPPAINVSEVSGVRRPEFGGTVDCQITVDNEGGQADTLALDVEFVVLTGSLTTGVADVSPPWTAGPASGDNTGQSVTFTRVGGLGASLQDTLRFTINSASGNGTIVVAPPRTTPTGANTGSSGTYGDDSNPVDLDVIGLNFNRNTGVFSLTVKNNGPAPVAGHTVAVTITPTSSTAAFNNDTQGNPGVVAEPPVVAPTSNPFTIEFTNTLPINTNTSVAFQFGIVRTGDGTVSATVTTPGSPKNNTRTGSYTAPPA